MINITIIILKNIKKIIFYNYYLIFNNILNKKNNSFLFYLKKN